MGCAGPSDSLDQMKSNFERILFTRRRGGRGAIALQPRPLPALNRHAERVSASTKLQTPAQVDEWMLKQVQHDGRDPLTWCHPAIAGKRYPDGLEKQLATQILILKVRSDFTDS